MLQFYYDCLDYFVDRRDYQALEMDTDSLYYALSAPNLEDVIKVEKRKEFFTNYHRWFPSESCF